MHTPLRHLLLLGFAGAAMLGCSKKEQAPPAADASNPLAEEARAIVAPALDVPAPATDPTAVVAVVNGENILQGDVDREVNMLMSRAQGRVPPEQMGQMRGRFQEQVLDHLVTMRILTQEAKKQEIAVTDDEVTAEIGKLEAQSQGRGTIEDMLKQLNATQEDLRRDIAAQLTISKLIEKQTTATPPTDEAVKAYYEANPDQFQEPENVAAHHILLAFQPEDTPETKAAKKTKAEELRARLVSGEDFSECAKGNSDCPSKARGGDLGTFGKGQMVPAFEEAAFSQAAGEIGPVVETEFGYHIIRVDEHKQARSVPFDEVKGQLTKYLASQGRRQVEQDYVASLRAGAQVTLPGATATAMP